MNIAVLGSGAMGSLFSGYLSKNNNVYLIGRDPKKLEELKKGIIIREKDDVEKRYIPNVAQSGDSLPRMDLIIVFVKAIDTLNVLESNKGIIDKNTYILTLQNGAGHESNLLKYANPDHVIIGSTQHNSSVIKTGHVYHGGGGSTSIGLVGGGSEKIQKIADTLTDSGFDCSISDSIKEQIWNKLFINTAASVLTAILQVPLGFILDDPFACSYMEKLLHEAVEVANAEGFSYFDEESVVSNVKKVLDNGKTGYTSIYADVKAGRRSEVETISGYVINRANALGIAVPYHNAVVTLIHAFEDKYSKSIN